MKLILDILNSLYETRSEEIEAWLGARRAEAPPLLTTSVDLRHAGFKLAPVDTNIYPAGFNNLSASALNSAARHMRDYLRQQLPKATRVLIVPESHTRNLAYLDSLHALSEILHAAGYEVKIGNISLTVPEVAKLTSLSGHGVIQHSLIKANGALQTADGYLADIIILNYDGTGGIPDVLQHISQPIFPCPELGWHTRRKSQHFTHYTALAADFAKTFSLDPWLLDTNFEAVAGVRFKQHEGLEPLAAAVERVLQKTRTKYAEYGITDQPYAFIKADGGTYGMGIMTVHSGVEVLSANKHARNKMSVIKEGAEVTEVLVQEGVKSIDVVEGAVAEPMVYMIDGVPVEGLYRRNPARDALGNLNAPGAVFSRMCEEGKADCTGVKNPCHLRSFGIIAAIAALAAGREAQDNTACQAFQPPARERTLL